MKLPKNWKVIRDSALEIVFVVTLSVLALLYVTEKTGIQDYLKQSPAPVPWGAPPIPPMPATVPSMTAIVPVPVAPPIPPMPATTAIDRGPEWEKMKQWAGKSIFHDRAGQLAFTYWMPEHYEGLYFNFDDEFLKKASELQFSWKQGQNVNKFTVSRRRLRSSLLSSFYCHTQLYTGRHRIDLGKLIKIPKYNPNPNPNPNLTLDVIEYITIIPKGAENTRFHISRAVGSSLETVNLVDSRKRR